MPNPSLSVVLPVHNAQQTLTDKVHQLLEILPDLTPRFEILVLNNGSTDQTDEVAHELSRVYPQVRTTSHPKHWDRQAAVETGLARTKGDIMFVQDENTAIDSSKLHRLWELRHEEELMFARPEFRMKQSLLKKLAAWGVRLEESTKEGGVAGVQMIRRQSVDHLDEIEDAVAGRRLSCHAAGAKDLRKDSHAAPAATKVARRSPI